METKPIEEMSEQEFDALPDKIADAEFDKLTPSAFLDAVWALKARQAEEVIEVTATVEGDGLRLSGPEGVIVRGNEIIVNSKRIVVRLAEVKR